MERIIQLMTDKIKEKDICNSHSLEHMINVLNHAIRAVKTEDIPEEIAEAIKLAALLHDMDDKKLFNTTNYSNAREILGDHPHKELIIEMISLVSMSENKDSTTDQEWKLIPRYCDRLEAIGEIGIERCLQYARTIGNPMHTENTLKAYTEEDLKLIVTKERYENYNGKSVSVIDHFYDKLLHISFPINNRYIKEIARFRLNIMSEFVLNYWNNQKI